MSSQRANSCSMLAKIDRSAPSMPVSVSSEKTTPKPNVSSAALRSHTSTSCRGSSCFASAAKYSPPGPPPTTAIRISAPRSPCLLRRAAQDVALHLAGGGAGQRLDELDAPRGLVRRDLLLDEFAQCGGEVVARCGGAGRNHECGHQLAAVRVRSADDGALGDVRMAQQRLLDLGPGNVVPRRDDHVVGAGQIVEVAVL